MTTLGQHAAAEAEAIASVPRGLFINGQWRASASRGTFAVEDPSTGLPLCEFTDGGAADGLDALAAAVAAQRPWAASAPRDRAAILRRAYDALIDAREQLALVLTLEMGKPLDESDDEISYAAEYLLWFAEEAMRIDGRYAIAPDASGRLLLMQQPSARGIRGGRRVHHGREAVEAGATRDPRTLRHPPGRGSPPGRAERGAGVLVPHDHRAPDRRRPAAEDHVHRLRRDRPDAHRAVLIQCAATLDGTRRQRAVHRVRGCRSRRGGGGWLVSKMRNFGEACTSANRFYIARSIAPEFTRRLTQEMSALRVGRGSEPRTQLGPLIGGASCDRLEELVGDAVDRGATLVAGGGRIDRPGHYFAPTVLADVPDDARVLGEEIFGPVAPVRPFDDEEEVNELANGTEFGLAGYLYTSEFDRAIRVAEALETGMVGLNQGRVSNPMAPLGGIKQSGLDRAGGPEAITEYLETKYVAIRHRGA